MDDARDDDGTVRIYVLPEQVFDVPVPLELWEDPARFAEFMAEFWPKEPPVPWYEKPVPAWIFLVVLGFAFIALVAAILWPLGIQL